MWKLRSFPEIVSDRVRIYLMKNVNPSLESLRLVKRNVWTDRCPKLEVVHVGDGSEWTIDPKTIELIPYAERDKPVVYNKLVYEHCFIDWDGDVVLKDDVNGVTLINSVFTDNRMYDEDLIEQFPDHPMNSIKQIKHVDKIVAGKTAELQLLIDLFYGKKSYL